MKEIYDWMKKLFKAECPDCGGYLKTMHLDMKIDTIIYKCVDCKGVFI